MGSQGVRAQRSVSNSWSARLSFWPLAAAPVGDSRGSFRGRLSQSCLPESRSDFPQRSPPWLFTYTQLFTPLKKKFYIADIRHIRIGADFESQLPAHVQHRQVLVQDLSLDALEALRPAVDDDHLHEMPS